MSHSDAVKLQRALAALDDARTDIHNTYKTLTTTDTNHTILILAADDINRAIDKVKAVKAAMK